MMQQSRRREHGSSGELDVFGATSYFAGLLPAPDDDDDCASSVTEPSSAADRLYFQANVMQRDTTTRMTTEDNSFRSPHQQQQQLAGVRDHAERHATNKLQLQLQVVAAKRQPSSASGKSKLAALLSFMVSPSPRASFRKENKQEAPPSSTSRLLRQADKAAAAASAAGGGEREPPANNTYCKATAASSSSSSRESSMQLQGDLFGANDDDGKLDLGVATGDRRLQGITVVKGSGDEERWVVRCVPGGACWGDEERREKVLDDAEAASSEQNVKDELVEVEEQLQGDDDGNNIDPAHSWDSDSSSDLFDLDLEYR